jgi:hypothetical protein
MPAMAPLYVSAGDRLVTVFGGGNVALRKIRHFDGFRIRVVSLKVLPEVEEEADEVILCEIAPATVRKYLEGAFIAVAATDETKLPDFVMTAVCVLYTLEPKGDATNLYGNMMKSFIEFNRLNGMMPVKAETKSGLALVFSRTEDNHYMFVAVKP